ncbi:MAG: DUF4097 family beta strand repeat-containing protein [Acidimicrobiia bacterium]
MIEREFPVDDSPVVKIAIRSGRVGVESGEPGVVRFVVDTSDPTFDIRQPADAIVASGERGGRAFVTVRVPSMANVEIATASGDINVSTPVGRLDASTASGDIDFDTTHRLQAKTASGGVRGKLVEGEANCVTASGDVRITQTLDRADFSTASGDVTIGVCSGSLFCATLSGNIRVDELTGPSVKIKSVSGGVRLGIPPRTRLDLDASSLSGRIRLPSTNPSPEPPEREISAKVRLVSGDLRIDRLD